MTELDSLLVRMMPGMDDKYHPITRQEAKAQLKTLLLSIVPAKRPTIRLKKHNPDKGKYTITDNHSAGFNQAVSEFEDAVRARTQADEVFDGK